MSANNSYLFFANETRPLGSCTTNCVVGISIAATFGIVIIAFLINLVMYCIFGNPYARVRGQKRPASGNDPNEEVIETVEQVAE